MQPTKLSISKDKKFLTIEFGEIESHTFSAEMLRVMSPSAEVQGHSPEQRKIVGSKRNVEIMAVSPVGNYAVRISFDDMHDTGIFTWTYFRELGSEKDRKWQEYLDALAEKGLTRDP